jgi:hypothetical protein
VAGVRGGELRIAAAAEEGEHAFANFESAYVGADGRYGACALEPQQRRFAERRRVVALALHGVGPVHARRVDANQDSAGGCGGGIRVP